LADTGRRELCDGIEKLLQVEPLIARRPNPFAVRIVDPLHPDMADLRCDPLDGLSSRFGESGSNSRVL
jgi:hypothetical protein